MESEPITCRRKLYFALGVVYFGQFMIGCTMGWSTPMIPILQNAEETPLDRVITDGEASWVVSITYIGIIAGPYISGYLCNVVGRKPCIFFGGSMLLVAYIMMALAKSLVMLYIGRALVGVGTGVLFVTNLVYIAELAPTKNRGKLLTMTGVSTAHGIVTLYSIGPYTSYTKVNWMVLFLCAEFVVVTYFTVLESPVYLVIKGKKEEAIAALRKLGKQDVIDEVVAQANDKPKPKLAQLTEMYTVKSNRKAAFIIMTLNILSQFSGMMVVMAFVTDIFDMTGLDIEPHISAIIIGTIQFVASMIVPALVDRIGRKILLLVSCAACSLSLFSLGTYFYLYNNGYPIADDLKWLSLASLTVFCFAYTSGMGIIPNIFVGEMFTDTCRGFGGTVTVTIGFLFAFGVATAFGYVLPVWGPSVVFWIFSGACALNFFFVVVFVPETNGKSLLEIQQLLSK